MVCLEPAGLRLLLPRPGRLVPLAALLSVLAAVSALGCTRESPPAPPAAETADDAMRRALGLALQAQGREAVVALRALDTTRLAPRYAPIRRCMLERLDARRLPPMPVAEPFVAGVLSAYRDYWLRSLRGEHPQAGNDAWLLAALTDEVDSATRTSASRRAAATLDDIEPLLDSLIRARGYHVLLGVTSPLRELMLWRTESPERYHVALPETAESVTVVFMDGFASLGWAGFATCDRSHSGGWTKPDRLYAVRSAYDTTTEDFRVSYLAHEAQHFADHRRFPRLERQEELEYRAKLTELALATSTVYDLLDAFAGNVSADTTVPHSFANGRVVRGLRQRLFGDSASTTPWRKASVAGVNDAAIALLRGETARLERAASDGPR